MLRRNFVFLSLTLLLCVSGFAQNINEELLAASRKGEVEAVRALLAKGADVNTKTTYGVTPLFYAASRGHAEVVKVLLERGAEVNVKDKFYGMKPLGWAASKGYAEVVRLLLDKGADDRDGALMAAVAGGHVDTVRVVLDKGGLKPETLTNALGNATRNKRTEIAELLAKAGAVPPLKADFQVDPETLKSYAGTYRSEQGLEVTLAVKDGKLVGGPTGLPASAFGAVDQTTFRLLEVDGVSITFNLEEGKVAGFTLKTPSGTNLLKKTGAK